MIKAVIFDLGGTLIERSRRSFEPDNATALGAWLRGRGVETGREFADAVVAEREGSFARRIGTREVRAADALRPVLGRYGLPTDDAFLIEAEAAFYEPELGAMRLLPGALEVLERLRAHGVRTGLASNATSHYFVGECCRRLRIHHYLDPIVSSAGLGWAKPDPRLFNAILGPWKIIPSQAVMVGDSAAADVAGARALGMHSILLTAEHRPGELRTWEGMHADAEASTLTVAGQIIERWLQER